MKTSDSMRVGLSTVGAAVLLASGTTLAQDASWVGATDGNFNTPSNWSPAAVPGSLGATGTATFNAASANTTITGVSSNQTIGVITFNTASAAAYTIGASAGDGTFQFLNAATVNLTSTVVNNQTINSNLALSNSLATSTFANASTAAAMPTLTIAGAVTGGTSASNTINLTGVNANTNFNVLGGAVTQNAPASTLGITVSSGRWTLSSPNSTYTKLPAQVTVNTALYDASVSVGGATLGIGGNSVGGSGTSVAPVTSGPLGTGALYLLSTGATLEARNGDHTIGNTVLTADINWNVVGSNSLTLAGYTILGGSNQLTNNIAAGKTLTFAGDLALRQTTTTGRTLTIVGTGTTVFTGAITPGSSTDGALVIGAGTVLHSALVKTTGTNTYNGLTTVHKGNTLVVNGSHNTGKAYTIVGTLAGTGTIAPTGVLAVTVGGNFNSVATPGLLSPGDPTAAAATGTLDIGKLTLVNASTYAAQLGGATPGDGAGFYDQVNVTSAAAGALTLNTGSVLDLSLASGFTPTALDVFYILTRADASATAAFAGLAEGATVTLPTGTAQITYLANWTGLQSSSTIGGGNDVAIYNVTVPEPASLAILAAGAGLLLRRRRA